MWTETPLLCPFLASSLTTFPLPREEVLDTLSISQCLGSCIGSSHMTSLSAPLAWPAGGRLTESGSQTWPQQLMAQSWRWSQVSLFLVAPTGGTHSSDGTLLKPHILPSLGTGLWGRPKGNRASAAGGHPQVTLGSGRAPWLQRQVPTPAPHISR